MELSENDSIMLHRAQPGDLVILSGGVVRVVDKTQVYVQYMILTCDWFRHCLNYATTIIAHPVIGDVPACRRCKELAA